MDLFEHPETWPAQLLAIFEAYNDKEDYKHLEQMKKECEAIGYTFDYGLDATPYNLKKIKK